MEMLFALLGSGIRLGKVKDVVSGQLRVLRIKNRGKAWWVPIAAAAVFTLFFGPGQAAHLRRAIPEQELLMATRAPQRVESDEYKIGFCSERDGDSEIYLMNQDGTGLTRLTYDPATDSLPYCSPDGARIVFSSDRAKTKQLYLIDIDGSNVTRLTHNLSLIHI